jgi:hypothetical protein
VFGLSFLSPLFLAGFAAAAIPIAIHLFYRRTEPVIDFAAMRYLRQAPVEHSRRRRLREMILLALRVAALCLLAFAFARPYLAQSAAALSAPVTMVLVDTSASMTAPGQFEKAKAAATRAVRAAAPNHSVGVMTFANAADVMAPPSQDRAGALGAIERLQPGAGATQYRSALARAVEAIGDRSGRFIVVTDLQQSGWDAADEGAVPDRVTVEVADVGSPASNVAISALRLEGTDAVALVRNYSTSPRREQVAFSIEGKRFTSVPVDVPAGGSVEARVSADGRSRGLLGATVTDKDGYAVDNSRYLVLDASQSPAVLAITGSGQPSDVFYLERAVLVAEDAGGFRFRAISGPAFSGLEPAALTDVGAVLVLGTRGVDARGRDLLGSYVKSGGGLLVAGGPDVDPKVLAESLTGIVPTVLSERTATDRLRFAPADSRHPVFRLFGGVGTLANVSFARTASLKPSDSAEVIARYTDGTAALVEDRATGGRVLIFASDLNNRWNDFPVQPAFVPFVHEMLRYLAAARSARADYVVGELPGASGATPGAVQLAASTGEGGEASAAPRAGRRVAVNVDPRESDPSRITVDAFRAGITRLNAAAAQQARAQAREREDTQRLWQYGLILMIASLAAEGVLGRRLG